MPSYTPFYNLAKPNVNDPIDENAWGGELNSDLDIIDTTLHTLSLNYGVPTGAMMAYGASTAPAGWLVCDASAVSRTIYAALFAVIGTNFGAGDGSTTFNLPDTRGRVIAGIPLTSGRITGASISTTSIGGNGGSETHTNTVSEMALHSHPWQLSQDSNTQTNTTGGFKLSTNNTQTETAYTGAPSNTQGQQIGGTGGGTAYSILQPTILAQMIIRT